MEDFEYYGKRIAKEREPWEFEALRMEEFEVGGIMGIKKSLLRCGRGFFGVGLGFDINR